ncbi:MAG: hypothetical protein QXQ13_04415 [Thermoplasmata archaeon]
MDAENITGLATGDGTAPADPWILPIMMGGANPQNAPGGWVNMSMYFTYLTSQEYNVDIRAGTHYANTHYGVNAADFASTFPLNKYPNDGWFMEAQGHFDFSRAAAAKFLGLPGTDDLRTEFNTKGAQVIADGWRAEWIADGDVGGPLDIYAAYDYHLYTGNGPVYIVLKLDALNSTADKLAIWFWSLTWGAEVLYTRYLQKVGIIEELEPYMEDWYLNITFSPTMGDVHSRMTTAYHMTVWKDTDPAAPFVAAYMWEPQHMDYRPSLERYPPISYYDPYAWSYNYKPVRTCLIPGQEYYGKEVMFWQTPMNWNLDSSEKLVIRLPVDRPGWGIEPYWSQNFTVPGLSPVEQRSHGYWGEWVLGHGYPSDDIYTTTYYDPATKTLTYQGPKSFARNPDQVYTNINETGSPLIMMDISRVSKYELTIDEPGPYEPGTTYTLRVTPKNFTGAAVRCNQTVELPAVAGVTYGATSHKFALTEDSWTTSVVFAAAGDYDLVSRDQYFYLDISDTFRFTVQAPGFVLQLKAGWNLVTVPPVGYGYKASTLGLNTGDTVARWDPATQKYDKTYIVNVTPPSLTDFDILPSTGYWIYVAKDTTLVLKGTIPTTQQSRTITVPSGGGWAIIGFNSLNTTWKASYIPGWYTDGAISTVAAYRNGKYVQYVKGVPATDFTLVPGEGYWVFCQKSGTLTYMP